MDNDYEHGIEVAQKNPKFPATLYSIITFGSGSSSLRLAYQADFIIDLTNFKVLKHRYGNADDLTPVEAAEWLTYYIEKPYTRVLLLTD